MDSFLKGQGLAYGRRIGSKLTSLGLIRRRF
jgi:hypothetical protein